MRYPVVEADCNLDVIAGKNTDGGYSRPQSVRDHLEPLATERIGPHPLLAIVSTATSALVLRGVTIRLRSVVAVRVLGMPYVQANNGNQRGQYRKENHRPEIDPRSR